jgi:hypothetical protein
LQVGNHRFSRSTGGYVSIRPILAWLALIALAAPAAAQHGGARSAPTTPPREATQFDFLVGQWEATIRVPASGLAQRLHGTPKLVGTWKAWRALDGWGLDDELRIMDGSGNPLSLARSVRVFDATAGKWAQSTLDVYRARFTTGTAEWRGDAMHVTGGGTDPEGRPYVSRTRFYDISAAGFKMQQDRSTDGGRTWTEGTLRLEAKRVADAAVR